MTTAKSHRDLRVYQLAFSSAKTIHEITKSFSSEEKYSLMTKSGAPHVPFVRILQKPGEEGNIRKTLSAN